MKDFISLDIEYFTSTLETPYAYGLFVKMIPLKDALQVEFRQVYLDRDEFTIEELEDEGLDPENEFEWKGSISRLWYQSFQDLLSKTNLEEEEKDNNCHINIRFADNNKLAGYPINQESWNYAIQELHQAILEISGKEYPLTINYVSNSSNHDENFSIDLIVSFSERKAFAMKTSENAEATNVVDWEKIKKTLTTVFAVDFNPETALEDLPDKNGIFLQPGDSLWYPIPEGIEKSERNKAEAEKIIKEFKAL